MMALLVTLGAFILILILARLKVPLPGAIFAGAVGCGLGLGMTGEMLAHSICEATIHPRTIGLVIIISCLMGLSGTMQTGGQMGRIVELAQSLMRRPAVAVAIALLLNPSRYGTTIFR